MVKTPYPSEATKKRPHMENITIAPEERESLITEMKRERKPSRRLRMHIALLRLRRSSPTEIACVLFCSRHHRLMRVASRFNGEGRAALDDRKARGPRPLLGEAANERLEKLIEEDFTWIMAGCARAGAAAPLPPTLRRKASRRRAGETVRRALHRLEYCWRRPRVVGPIRIPRADGGEARKAEDVRKMTEEEVASFFQDETKLETNPKVGFCWMRKGRQRRLKTPGTNRKVWISGALNFRTGRLHWVSGQRRDGELFVKLLDRLRRINRRHKQLHLAGTTTQATSANGSRSMWRTRKDASISIPCPRGRRRATRWSLCGGLCTRQSAATTSARGWTIWWSSLETISKRGSHSDRSSEKSTIGWNGCRHEIGQVFIYLVRCLRNVVRKESSDASYRGRNMGSLDFEVGDCVRVKEGVTDPDSALNIGGWQGGSQKSGKGPDGEPFVVIAWDSHTLRDMPEWYLE